VPSFATIFYIYIILNWLSIKELGRIGDYCGGKAEFVRIEFEARIVQTAMKLRANMS
jgi:hypothetical protein